MRFSNKTMNQGAGNDSMHAAAMAGMYLANEGRRKQDRNLWEAQASQFAEDGDVRFERVARLRAAFAAGTYRVSSADLAAKLMGSMLR